ncbi:MAG: flagellar brake protein [Azonexus sp.]|jgi:c-di-GMP-binding flagellar brake protein YcgR|nr:flagellar brake protein [Azonexus sp.]
MTPPSDEPDASPSLTQQAVTEVLPTDEFSQYLLYSKSEILPVLRGLVEHVSQVTMMFNAGRNMVLSSLISCGDDGVVLEFGASTEMNRKALKADKLFCVSQLDKVKIQFILSGVDQIEVGGRPAFHAPLPDSVLRLQRREFYRLVTPVVQALKCRIRVPEADGSSIVVEAHVADISGGGVLLVGLPLNLPLEADMELSGCRIELPEIGLITFALRLRSLTESVSRSGIRAKRAGCEFVHLPGPMARLVQRYIMKIERERKMRESGMI